MADCRPASAWGDWSQDLWPDRYRQQASMAIASEAHEARRRLVWAELDLERSRIIVEATAEIDARRRAAGDPMARWDAAGDDLSAAESSVELYGRLWRDVASCHRQIQRLGGTR